MSDATAVDLVTIHVLRWLFQPFFRAPLDAFLLTLLSNNRAPMGAHGHGGAWALPRALGLVGADERYEKACQRRCASRVEPPLIDVTGAALL